MKKLNHIFTLTSSTLLFCLAISCTNGSNTTPTPTPTPTPTVAANHVVFSVPASYLNASSTGHVSLILSNPQNNSNLTVNLASNSSNVTITPSSCTLNESSPNCNLDLTAVGSAGSSAIITAQSSDNQQATLQVNIGDNSHRYVTFVNKCSENVWFGIDASSVNATNSHSTSCNPNGNDCPNGASCINTGSSSVPVYQCFWQNFAPANNNYKLAPNAINSIAVTPSTENDVVWDATFVARQGCNEATGECEVGGCPPDSSNPMKCKSGTGFSPPVTQAEVTMVGTDASDGYDIEAINGANTIGIAISPNNETYASSYNDTNLHGNNIYYCGSAGVGFTQKFDTATLPNSLPASPWILNPPSSSYNLVSTDTSVPCSQDSTCASINSNYVCGYNKTEAGFNGAQHSPYMTCGKKLAYLTAFEFCALNPNNNTAPFYCASATNGINNNTLYQCTNLATGYPAVVPPTVNNDDPSVCGCENWSGAYGSPTVQCSYSNPAWINTVLPKLSWLKSANPTGYTYTFDDVTSSFACSNVNLIPPFGNTPSTVNYTVTFCPNNQ